MTKLVAGTVAVAVSVDPVDGEQHRRHAVQKRGGGRLSILGYVEEGGGFGGGHGDGVVYPQDSHSDTICCDRAPIVE